MFIMARRSEEYPTDFLKQFLFGVTICVLALFNYAMPYWLPPTSFSLAPLWGGSLLFIVAAYFLAPFLLARKVIVDDQHITFKPINVKYPLDRVKHIKQVYRAETRVIAVQLVTERAPNI